MTDFIPIEFYTPIFYYACLIFTLLAFVHTQTISLYRVANKSFLRNLGTFTFLFTLFYLGFRPIDQVFGDMRIYGNLFEYYREGNPITSLKDPLFHLFALSASKLMNIEFFFFACAVLYVVPLYIISKKWFHAYWFYGFFFLIISFSFWAYGTNGIRNGIASSLFLLGMSRENRAWQILWIFISINFHYSMLLPTVGFIIANVYNRPKLMIVFWLTCIPLSLFGGSAFELFFSTLGFDDERISYFLTEANKEKFSSVGFRWDFLIYSATAVFIGGYYILHKKFDDKIYYWLFNTYVFSNAFWILVIRANFSNRFAYLSWFMMALIIVYPLLRKQIFFNQHKKIGFILMTYFAFTFIMNVILA